MKKGKVTLVGAGPGDAELITVKGMKAIQSADIVLYDALIGEDILDFARPDAELIYVGKRCGQHSLKQEDINALIVQCALRSQHIVRLKGGDPFVFGRGHEELTFLKKHKIDVEIIPGISSSISLPLLQRVPLTKRRIAESFWVLTGTTKSHQLSSDIRLAAQSSATLVILMGMRKLTEICDVLIAANKTNIPVMVISNGSTATEKVALGTASNIATEVTSLGIGAPGIIVVGEVVALHPKYIQEKVIQQWS